jgi:hypothetical protein
MSTGPLFARDVVRSDGIRYRNRVAWPMRGSMVDGRQRPEVRGLNIKCGPCVGSLCHTDAQRITDASGNDQGRGSGDGGGGRPRGGDAGLNRVGYCHRLPNGRELTAPGGKTLSCDRDGE